MHSLFELVPSPLPQITPACTTKEDGYNMKGVMAGTKRKLFYQWFPPVEFTKPHNALSSQRKLFQYLTFYPGSAATGLNKLVVRKRFFRGKGLTSSFCLTLHKGPSVIHWKVWKWTVLTLKTVDFYITLVRHAEGYNFQFSDCLGEEQKEDKEAE